MPPHPAAGLQFVHWDIAVGLGLQNGGGSCHFCRPAILIAREASDLPGMFCHLQVNSILLKDNMLTGPAFPPTWLLPGAMPFLTALDVSDNRALTGTLPAEWSFWPSVIDIYVGRTALHGTVPRQWCSKATRFQEASTASPLRLQEV